MPRLRLLLGAAAAALSLLAADAEAGEYQVAQCHSYNAAHQASSTGASRGDYVLRDECATAPEHALEVLPNSSSPSGYAGYWYWEAPPGTKIVGVEADAKLRRADGHKARLFMADGVGRMTTLVASGQGDPTGFEHAQWSAPAGSSGSARFYAALVCDNAGADCLAPSDAKTYVRNVELTLRDTVAPTVEVELPSGPWMRGSFGVDARAKDFSSGVESEDVLVNGASVMPRIVYPCRRISGTGLTSALSPCVAERTEHLTLNSDGPPFHDGTNRITVCARDFSTSGLPNPTCAQRTVAVDNTPPDVAFRNAQEVADPELIRAPAFDVTSGLRPGSGLIEVRRVGTSIWERLPTALRDGELEARIDSEARPEGVYEFRATAGDVAGNQSSTILRADGEPMQLHFPLKQQADLDAFFPGGQTEQLADYRQGSKVRGFLRRPDGSPVADEPVVIEETFDEGSLIQHRTVRAMTEADGSFVSSIPGGPSREVQVTYAGSRRYMDDAAPELDYDVKTKVGLQVERRVRAGNSVHFRGRVGRYFARVPAGGKLVELQFKKSAKSWSTTKQALGTTSRGRVRIPYRFRRYYTEPVTFVFRLKVTREGGWPYRLPAASKPVQVTVVPPRR